MPKIKIDNKTYDVKEGQNLLHVALSLGLDLPYFCWHPSLGSVGACRQCAVQHLKDENDTTGRLVMACMTPATEGSCFSISHPTAKEFRENVIEWLMTNHPHDCPVCDEGGDCHLQDMTVMSGHNYRRYKFKKRTHNNQYLGPFINHEMNRCIACYRCVRYYRDYAGGTDLNSFASGNRVYFGRAEDGVLENEFSGNLVEVCPTGVFTDKTTKQHYTRKWDLQTAPSVCSHCSIGCNTSPGERYGQLRKITNRYNSEVNAYFLCDRGRFGYEFVNSPKRVKKAKVRAQKGGEFKEMILPEALAHVAKILKTHQSSQAGKLEKVAAIGSTRASLENNFALKQLVGAEYFYNGLNENDNQILQKIYQYQTLGTAHSPSLREIESSDSVLILGEDVTQTGARMALALRQAARVKPVEEATKAGISVWNDAAVRNYVQQKKGPFFTANAYETALDEVALANFYGNPEEIAFFGQAVAAVIRNDSQFLEAHKNELNETTSALVKKVASEMKAAKKPLVVSGASLMNQAVVDAAAAVAFALKEFNDHKQSALSYILPEANSMGMAYLENGSGQSLESLAQKVAKGEIETLVILENDLYRKAKSDLVQSLLKSVKNIIVLDHTETSIQEQADVVLSTTTFAEGAGTFINQEGRAQRFYKVFAGSDEQTDAWRWIKGIMLHTGIGHGAQQANQNKNDSEFWQNLDGIFDDVCATSPLFQIMKEKMPRSTFRYFGLKIARGTLSMAGRTAMNAHKSIHEPKTPVDIDSPMTHSMGGFAGIRPSSLTSFVWKAGWNSNQAGHKFQAEAGGPMIGGDAGVRLLSEENSSALSKLREAKTESVIKQILSTPFVSKKTQNQEKEHVFNLLPVHHLFGSDELSSLATGLAQRIPAPYVGMGKDDFNSLAEEQKQGQSLKFELEGRRFKLPIKIKENLPKGYLALPVGLPQSIYIDFHQTVKVQ